MEGARSRSGSKRPQKVSLPASKAFSRVGQEQPTEETRQHADRQKEVGPAGDPTGAIGRETATGDDAVQVRMMEQRLAPRVEDGEEADLGAEVLGIGGDRAQGLGGGVEQDVVDRRLVLVGDGGDLVAAR